jgi:hypothetical protein
MEHMRRLLCCVLLTGCIERDYEDPYVKARVHIGLAEVDELEVVYASGGQNYWRNKRATGPLTPVLIARGVTEQPVADLWSLDAVNDYGTILRVADPEPGTSYDSISILAYVRTPLLLAVGRRIDATGNLVAVAAAFSIADSLEQGTNTVELTLAAVEIEEWGPRACKRYRSGESSLYVVSNSDFDCDGMFTDMDCRPEDYCDPLATSGPLADNCVCP